MRFYCRCGSFYSKAGDLREHIGLCNPRWPRSTPEDKHWRVTEEEWRAKRNAAYRSLREE